MKNRAQDPRAYRAYARVLWEGAYPACVVWEGGLPVRT
jgi:hypothetical protein